MANKNSTGTMTLPSRTAVALWVNELCGQISDGMWENSGPRDHWQFWCRLDVVEGPVASVTRTSGWCRKNSYAFSRLFSIVGDRMLATGRMAKVCPDPTDREVLHAAEYMPATLNEFRAAKASGKWQYDFVAKYMDKVSDDLAVQFYCASYTMKEMRSDVNLIKSTMKTVAV